MPCCAPLYARSPDCASALQTHPSRPTATRWLAGTLPLALIPRRPPASALPPRALTVHDERRVTALSASETRMRARAKLSDDTTGVHGTASRGVPCRERGARACSKRHA